MEPNKSVKSLLFKSKFDDANILEIGIDEAGRGPLFGPVFAAAVILPKDDSFDYGKMKDSKKFHSKKKIQEVANYIKENAIAWSVCYETEKTIDDINILQATQKAMHSCIKEIMNNKLLQTSKNCATITYNSPHLLIDGNYFVPIHHFNEGKKQLEYIPYTLVEGGDNKFSSIAAASILAKVARDQFISELCESNPDLDEKYGINSNKGYGAKRHIDGINQHGITIWHRRTFGICKRFTDI
jgi:ribonuclease HII